MDNLTATKARVRGIRVNCQGHTLAANALLVYVPAQKEELPRNSFIVNTPFLFKIDVIQGISTQRRRV